MYLFLNEDTASSGDALTRADLNVGTSRIARPLSEFTPDEAEVRLDTPERGTARNASAGRAQEVAGAWEG